MPAHLKVGQLPRSISTALTLLCHRDKEDLKNFQHDSVQQRSVNDNVKHRPHFPCQSARNACQIGDEVRPAPRTSKLVSFSSQSFSTMRS